MGGQHTPGPWHLCQHLKSAEDDAGCSCGYRGVIFGPEHDIAYAVCQPGHEPAPVGQEGTEPARYPREVELANAHLIAAAPDLIEALQNLVNSFEKHRPKEYWDAARAAIAKARGHE